MNNKDNPSPLEAKESPPVPNSRDLVLIDGQFAQCCAGSSGGVITFRLLENQSEGIRISPEEWSQYEYQEPSADMICARQLVEKGLMSEEQLGKVFWGPGEEKNPYLKGVVTFFGTYTKKK